MSDPRKLARALAAARAIRDAKRGPGRPPLESRIDEDDDRALLARARLRKEAALAARHEIRNELLRGETVRVADLERGWSLAIAGLRRVFERLVALAEDPIRARQVASDGLEAVIRDTRRALEEARAEAGRGVS